MPKLNRLLREVQALDPLLGGALRREVNALAERPAFGLHFERHPPQAVALTNRPVGKGDKVRVLPERGAKARALDERVWRVVRMPQGGGEGQVAILAGVGAAGGERTRAAVENLAPVAEPGDPIRPGLVSTDRIERGGERPFHVVINAENGHALQVLQHTHAGRIDAIYIDPPYNSGARDWRYNNDYVDADDAYRHSRWLAMMERRLLLAKPLLNPRKSVLIAAIDEREVHRLGLLLEQTFPGADLQMITSVVSAKGVVRTGKFSRVEEHLFVATMGCAAARPWRCNMLEPRKGERAALDWLGLRRREPTSVRGARPNQFYPIFINLETNAIHSIGDPLEDAVDRDSITPPEGARAVWPLKPDGTEMLWGLTPSTLRRNLRDGYVRLSKTGVVQYLQRGTIEDIRNGVLTITGRDKDGSVKAARAVDADTTPKRVWHMRSHNAEVGGTRMLAQLIPGRRFPYPKSLYAVEDVLRFYLADAPDAVVLDFFAGSGTTAHAVMRLNRQDGGRRQSISVTNNEIAPEDAKSLCAQGRRPGDPEWERLGVCEHVTKPRVKAAVLGAAPEGRPIRGAYQYNDECPLAEGFHENVECFTMTCEAPRQAEREQAFRAAAPLLWLRAGAQGRRIEKLGTGFDVADCYAVLFDLDATGDFLAAVAEAEDLRMVFIVADEAGLRTVCSGLPDRVAVVRLDAGCPAIFPINAE